MVTAKDWKQFEWSPRGDQQKTNLTAEWDAVATEGAFSS